MSITLYPHQHKFVDDLRIALRSHQAVLAQASTGFGKTVVVAHMAKSASAKGKRVLFTVHRKDLLRQTSNTFKEFGIEHGIIAAGHIPNPYAPVQIASIQTLQNRLENLPFYDLVVPDEAHLSAAKGQKKVLLHCKSRGSKLVGLTATPERLSGEGLDDIFDAMVQGPSMAWLIQNGYLSDYKVYAPTQPDLQGVHSRMGDYITSELETTMDKPFITGSAISHYKKLAYGKRALAFCISIPHSQHVAAQFRSEGIMAVHIDGETKHEDRLKAFKAFAMRDIQVITSVALFCEGFDLSSQIGEEVPIESIISIRPTQSLALHLQQVGRGLRKKDSPAIILDHSGNVIRLGLPDDDREWTLEGKKRTKKDKTEVSIRQCPKCYAVHHIAPSCPNCGFVYVVNINRDINVVDGELEEVDKDALRRKIKQEQGNARTLDQLIALGKARGHKNPWKWAGHVWTARQAKKDKRGN